MAIYTLARFEVKPEAREQAELAMHEFASYVRQELDDSMWTAYREDDCRYVALIRANTDAAVARHRESEGTQKFLATLEPLLTSKIELGHLELVTSSDLAPRHRSREGRSPRHRRRLGR
jgi:quinol monooxygenase YgiN